MSRIVERQAAQEREIFAFASERPREIILVTSKPYRCKSYSLIGWTGPRVKGVLVRRKYRNT